jgi:hypothetical protein
MIEVMEMDEVHAIDHRSCVGRLINELLYGIHDVESRVSEP